MIESITEWLQVNREIALWVVPAIAFAEACIGLGLFVSGAILVAVCSTLLNQNIATIPQMLPLAFIGAFVSDHMGFYIGHWLGPGFHRTAFAQRHEARLQKADQMIDRWGWGAILIGRLMTAIRSIVPLMTGISGYPRWRYTLFDALACGIWTAGLGAILLGVASALG